MPTYTPTYAPSSLRTIKYEENKLATESDNKPPQSELTITSKNNLSLAFGIAAVLVVLASLILFAKTAKNRRRSSNKDKGNCGGVLDSVETTQEETVKPVKNLPSVAVDNIEEDYFCDVL